MPTFDEYPFIIVLRPLRNPDDLDTFILVPVVESIATRDQKDNSQVRIIQLRNDRGVNIEPGRSTHARTVNRKIGTPEDFIEDDSNTAVVERIDWIPMRDQKTDSMVFIRSFRNTDEDDTWPATPLLLEDIRNIAGYRVLREVVRVTADNEPDGSSWVDLELTFMTVVGDPKTDSQIYAYRFHWPEFSDLPINDPDDPYKPYFLEVDPTTMQIVDDGEGVDDVVPFRDSPLQNIVNINWGDAILVVSLEVDETNAAQVEEFIFTSPVIPERVARAATATTPAVPPLPALSDDTGIFMYGSEAHPFVFAPNYIYGNLLFPDIKPGTFKYYVKNFSAWMLKDAVGTSTTGFSNGNATKTVTWFVNLGRMLLTQPLVNGHKHVKYTLNVPGLGTVPTVYHKWRLIADGVNDVGDPFHYEIPANDASGLGNYYGYARDVLLPASILPGTTSYSIIDEGPMLEWIPFFQQPVINWKLTFSTWAGRKDFPLNDQCLPDRTLVNGKPKWDITKAASLVIKTGGGGPVTDSIMTIDVDSVGLKLTVTSVDVP